MNHRIRVGQVVHYVASESAKYPRRRYPAIVVHVEDDAHGIVNLTVFNEVVATGSVSRVRVAYAKDHVAGTWHYPDLPPDEAHDFDDAADVDL